MGIFGNAFKSFFSSKEEAQMNAKKTMELKDEWCEKSGEYENLLSNVMKYLRDGEDDWLEIEEVQSEFHKADSAFKWIPAFAKKIGTYKLKKSDFPGFEELEETNNIITIYLHFKGKLAECYGTYLGLHNHEKEWLVMVDEFDGNGLDDLQDKLMVAIDMGAGASLKMKDVKDMIEDFETSTRNSHDKTIMVDRIKKEYNAVMDMALENGENEGKIIELYEKKKKKINPNWKPKRYKCK